MGRRSLGTLFHGRLSVPMGLQPEQFRIARHNSGNGTAAVRKWSWPRTSPSRALNRSAELTAQTSSSGTRQFYLGASLAWLYRPSSKSGSFALLSAILHASSVMSSRAAGSVEPPRMNAAVGSSFQTRNPKFHYNLGQISGRQVGRGCADRGRRHALNATLTGPPLTRAP